MWNAAAMSSFSLMIHGGAGAIHAPV
jgi:hypothetical protein